MNDIRRQREKFEDGIDGGNKKKKERGVFGRSSGGRAEVGLIDERKVERIGGRGRTEGGNITGALSGNFQNDFRI